MEASRSERHPAATGCRNDSTSSPPHESREELPVDTTRGASGVPADHHPRSHTAARRTFYRSGRVVVTDQWFVTPDRRYAVSRMQDVRTARGAQSPIVLSTAVAAAVVWVAVGASLLTLPPMMVG